VPKSPGFRGFCLACGQPDAWRSSSNCHYVLLLTGSSEKIARMNGQGRLKLRLLADFIFFCIFGFAAPHLLAPISRSWEIRLASYIAFFICAGCLYDGFRTMAIMRKSDSH
jgi:hypothetical protein